jgi:(p)ppGpp synthase/HD superfamily hydrolase
MLSSRFEAALGYALEVHAGQTRKQSTVPYISHILIVAGTALEYGGDEDIAIAALLHDAVEDGGGDARAIEIRERFGDRVADIVLGCTDSVETPKPSSRERKRRHLEHLKAHADDAVLFVVACDKLANIRSILKDYYAHGDTAFDKFNVSKLETMDYYRQLVDVLTARGESRVATELAREVAELHSLVEGDSAIPLTAEGAG